MQAARRRLQEEMGFDTELKKAFDFIYKTPFENGLTEHEFDHVFVGIYDGEVDPNPEEVNSFRYRKLAEIKRSLDTHPADYTAWFKIAFPKVEAYLASLPAQLV